MKYTYAYKTADGTRHEGAMEAKCREDVFAALRAKGIKPIKVVAADGAKANGEIHGVRKRAVVAIVLLVAAGVGVVAYLGGTRSAQSAAGVTLSEASAPRHQIYGDPAVMEAFERGQFGEVFTNRLDQLLAWYAAPGRLMCPRDTDPRQYAEAFAAAWAADEARGENPIVPTAGDSRETKELKQIVNGMRAELVAYLANGNGTPRSYWRRLWERLQQESLIFERTRRELEDEKDPAVWEKKNASLRRIGLRTIPHPSDDR